MREPCGVDACLPGGTACGGKGCDGAGAGAELEGCGHDDDDGAAVGGGEEGCVGDGGEEGHVGGEEEEGEGDVEDHEEDEEEEEEDGGGRNDEEGEVEDVEVVEAGKVPTSCLYEMEDVEPLLLQVHTVEEDLRAGQFVWPLPGPLRTVGRPPSTSEVLE